MSWSATAAARWSSRTRSRSGQTQALEVSPPVRMQSSDGSLEVTVDGQAHGALGETGRTAQDVFTALGSAAGSLVSVLTSCDGDPRVCPQRGRLRGWPGGSEADGFRLVTDPDRRGHRRWSTPAASSSRPRRTPSTRSWRPPTCSDTAGTAARPRPSSRSAAWPSGTAPSWPRRCPRPTRCSASTTTPTSPRGSGRSWRGRPTTRTPRRTVASCYRSARPSGPAPWSRRARPPRGGDSTARRPHPSSWPTAATAAAPSARSRRSAARS